jgi:predicted phosphodiesterase
MVRRAALIGDVHAEDRALAAVLAHLDTLPNLDAVLCTGDVVTGPGDAARCVALLRERGVYTVRGNHDRWFVRDENRKRGWGYTSLPHATEYHEVTGDDRAWLAALPPTRDFDTPLGPLLLCHGTGTDDMTGVYPGDGEAALAANHQLVRLHAEEHYRVLINGHTHKRMLRRLDHLTLVNPGTLKRGPDARPGFLVADFAAGTLAVFDLDHESLTITAGATHALPPSAETPARPAEDT